MRSTIFRILEIGSNDICDGGNSSVDLAIWVVRECYAYMFKNKIDKYLVKAGYI